MNNESMRLSEAAEAIGIFVVHHCPKAAIIAPSRRLQGVLFLPDKINADQAARVDQWMEAIRKEVA